MTERPTLDRFIVRIYRVDMKKSGKIAGLVEATDGSGRRESFVDAASRPVYKTGLGKREEKNRTMGP
jgi:hypothetical protein